MSDETADDEIGGPGLQCQPSDIKPSDGSPPLDEAALEDFILATAPEFADAMREADEELKAGETRSLADVLGEIGTVSAPGADSPGRVEH